MKVNRTFSIELEIVQDPVYIEMTKDNASKFIEQLVVKAIQDWKDDNTPKQNGDE